MKLFSITTYILSLSGLLVEATPSVDQRETKSPLPWKLPFYTKGSKIISRDGKVVKHVGSNWVGHQEAMIPEGLQYSSIKDIVAKVQALRLNTVRLTFAMEMIEDILYNGGDVTLETSLTRALGPGNGTKVLNQILAHNPRFTKRTKRLAIFDAVAEELAAKGIYVHLDNHSGKGIWCCPIDGNRWFGGVDFNVERWVKGWAYISKHASRHWPSYASASLRNELGTNDVGGEPYDWYTWYIHMTAAAKAVHAVSPDALIYFSGIDWDSHIETIPRGDLLKGTNGTSTEGKSARFVPSKFRFKNKIVLELHRYDRGPNETCSSFADTLYDAGYYGLGDSPRLPAKYEFPFVLSEWGFRQDGIQYLKTTYNKCMIEFFGSTANSGWMHWPLGGSYYVRTRDLRSPSVHDDDEAWGLLNHNWTAVRSQVTVDNSLTPMIKATLSGPKK